jgi:tRNA 2-thiouridine synthesizing protein C
MMARNERKKLLVVIRCPPYGSSLARASLDVALAAAAFDQQVKLLFLGDGVLQLLPDQDSRTLGMKNQARTLTSLPLYDIEQVYADAEAASSYRIDLQAAPVPALPLDTRELQQLLGTHDQLLGF